MGRQLVGRDMMKTSWQVLSNFVPDRRLFPTRSKRKKYPYPRFTFSHKNPKEIVNQFYFNTFFTQLRENEHGSQGSFIKPKFFFRKTLFTLILTFQPYYLIIPRSRRQIYVDLGNISTGSEKVATGCTCFLTSKTIESFRKMKDLTKLTEMWSQIVEKVAVFGRGLFGKKCS